MPELKIEHPSAARIGEIREGIKTQIPRAERVLKRTNPNPNRRDLINVAGELYKQQKEAEAAGEIDPKTGLLNDKGFFRRVKEELEKAKRTGNKVAIVFFDLNKLKTVNDELGHDVGDEYIRTGADILSASFRPGDIISRRGEKADEFMVALQVSDMKQIPSLYGRVNEVVAFANQNWEGYPILFPAGAVDIKNEDIDDAIRRADHAMYRAKNRSKEINRNVLLMRAGT